ncbi:hypothetical protein NDN08_006477 [Rhodosorus marinus]|uniref:Uncharacterized protein n=1 Tax=Rhodosorus marinus TaxID=101924 RepID=A0AAV8UHQ8_9RHOD|nr:hypothetical protein NDN08_006477 [Rhodosorus marinus]
MTSSSLPVSNEEFGRLVSRWSGLFRSGGRVGGTSRVTVWVNGSASSIALAVLAARHFKEHEEAKVSAVITPIAEKVDELDALADGLRKLGVDAFLASYNSESAVHKLSNFGSPSQFCFFLRESARLNAHSVLTWHSRDHQMYIHAQNLKKAARTVNFTLPKAVSEVDTAPRVHKGGRLQNGSFNVLRPFLSVSSSRLEATCKELGLNPIASDQQLCWEVAKGMAICERLTEEEKRGLDISRRTADELERRSEALCQDFLQDVIFECDDQGMIVIHRQRVRDHIAQAPSIIRTARNSLVKAITAASGKQLQSLRRSKVDALFKSIFLSKVPKGKTLGRVQIQPQTKSCRYVQRHNSELIINSPGPASNRAGRQESMFESGDLVAMFRERGFFRTAGRLPGYAVPLGDNEMRIWDWRFVVGAFTKPPAKLMWPSRADGGMYAKELYDDSQARRLVPRDVLMTLLDEICEDRSLSPGPEGRKPFIVRAVNENDIEDLLRRHPPLRYQLEIFPPELLKTIPCVQRHGELLAIPTLGINYEPQMTFAARLIHYPSQLPARMHPAFDLVHWT